MSSKYYENASNAATKMLKVVIVIKYLIPYII